MYRGDILKTGMVIIHYNDLESVTNLIKNVSNYKVLDRVVIVDNNSKKEIKNELKKLANKKIKLIENSENKGFAYAINIGCKELIKEFKECNIIVSNCDIIIDKEEDIKELVNRLDNKKVGVVAPVILENNKLNRGWKQPGPLMDSLLNVVYIHRILRKKYVFYSEEHYKDETSKVDVVSGCFFLLKSKTLEKVNYFDEKTFLYYEENILAKKIKNINLDLIVCNDIIIIHNHSVSIDKNLKKINKLKIQKQSQYYFQTNYNNANWFEKFLLKGTALISRIILTIVYFLKDLTRK